MRRALVLVLVAVSSVACTGDAPNPPQVPDRSVVPYERSGQRSSPLPNGQYRFWPGSAPAELGVVYAFEIYVHCGIDFLLDFDGSYWDLASSSPPLSPGPLPSNEEHGTIQLGTEDIAEFRSDRGSVVRFSRRDGPKDVGLCS